MVCEKKTPLPYNVDKRGRTSFRSQSSSGPQYFWNDNVSYKVGMHKCNHTEHLHAYPTYVRVILWMEHIVFRLQGVIWL